MHVSAWLCQVVLLIVPVWSGAAADGIQHVRLGADGRFFINDAAVFPIGYAAGPLVGALAPDGKPALEELRQEGYIFQRWACPAGKWGPESEQQLDTLLAESNRLGTKVVISIRDLQGTKPGEQAKIAELRRVVTKYRNNPAIVFWLGLDEPQWGRTPPENLRVFYDTVHELDRNHPVWLNQAPRGTVEQLRPYNPVQDIGGMDIYPVGYPPGGHSAIANKALSVTGDYTKMIGEATNHEKPLLMYLQICWSGVTKPGKTLRFPTFPDERYMSYQAIIDGARGLVYFGGGVPYCWNDLDTAYGWNWTFYNRVLRPVLDELRPDGPLYPALVAPNSKIPVHVEGASDVEYAVREAGGFVYILAAKREGETVQAAFSGLPADVKGGEVLFEAPRTVQVEGGLFSDWFGPNEVHVYRFRRAAARPVPLRGTGARTGESPVPPSLTPAVRR